MQRTVNHPRALSWYVSLSVSASLSLSFSPFVSIYLILFYYAFFLSSKAVIKSIIPVINIKLLFSLSFLRVKLLRAVNGLVIDSRSVKENTVSEGGS